MIEWAVIWFALKRFAGALPWQAWLAIGIAFALLVAGLYVHHTGYAEGSAEAVQQIEEANDAAAHKADRGSSEVDDCYRAGGHWDRSRGVCHHGIPRQ